MSLNRPARKSWAALSFFEPVEFAISLIRYRMLNKHQQFGKNSEVLAIKHLKRKGYKILECNYRTKTGEIDIIAKEKDTLVFVEVKARSSSHFGGAKSSVTPKKQVKISMAALQYLKDTNQSDAKARFDVVAIDSRQGLPSFEIIKNAFELAYR